MGSMEFQREAPLKVRIQPEQCPARIAKELIREVARNHFAYRVGVIHLEFKSLTEQDRTSLLNGLSS
jgi:hypothetical protein